MVSITAVEAPPTKGTRRTSVEYAEIIAAANADPGQWLAVDIEGRTPSQLGSIAQHLKKAQPLFQVQTRTIEGKPVLYVCAPKTVATKKAAAK
jgi:hypothetical protein